MKIINHLDLFLRCVKRWETLPSFEDFRETYYAPLSKEVGIIFDDEPRAFFSVLEDLDWSVYRESVLNIDPAFEETRLKKRIAGVENFFGFQLEGEAVLFGAFMCMDGYARFDRGTHRVFLGVHENHGPGTYLDILIAHELTHVARESRPEVWEGLGLNPKMTHDEFTENQPVIEHLMGEGYSCLISEILVPGRPLHEYSYQTAESFSRVIEQASVVDREVHTEIDDPNGNYGSLYSPRRYGRGMPPLTHYVWAMEFARSLAVEFGAKQLVDRSSKSFVTLAKQFKLADCTYRK